MHADEDSNGGVIEEKFCETARSVLVPSYKTNAVAKVCESLFLCQVVVPVVQTR